MSLTQKQINEMLSQLQPGTNPANALGQLTLMSSQQVRNDWQDITKKQRDELAKQQREQERMQAHLNERRFGHADPNVFGLHETAQNALRGKKEDKGPNILQRALDWREETNANAEDLSYGQSFFRGTSGVIDALTMSRLFGGDGLTKTAVNKWGNDWMQQALTDNVGVQHKVADVANLFGGAMVPVAGMYKGVDAGLTATRAGANALARQGQAGNIAYRARDGQNLAAQSWGETAGIGALAGLGYNVGENTMAGIGPGGDQRPTGERALTTIAELGVGAVGDVAARGLVRLFSRSNPQLAKKLEAGEPLTPQENKLVLEEARKLPPEQNPFNVLADQQPNIDTSFDLLGGRSQVNPKIDFNVQSSTDLNTKNIIDDNLNVTTSKLKEQEKIFVKEQKEAINSQIKQIQQQAKKDLDEFKTTLKNTEDAFVQSRLEQSGYNNQKFQWEMTKKAKSDMKELQAIIGERIFIPKQNRADFPEFPKGLSTSTKANGRYDIYKAAEVAGFDNVEEFAKHVSFLSKMSKTRQKDVMTVNPKELETQLRQEFKQSQEYQALQDTFNQIKQGYDEQLAQFKNITDKQIKDSFQHTNEYAATMDTLSQINRETNQVNVRTELLGQQSITSKQPKKTVTYKLNKDMPKRSQQEFENYREVQVDKDGKLQVADSPELKVSSVEKQLSDTNAVFKKLDAMINGVKSELTGVASSLWKQAERLGRARGMGYDVIDKKLKPALRELAKSNGKYSKVEFDDYVQAMHYNDIYKQKKLAEKNLPLVTKQMEEISVKLQDSNTKGVRDLKNQLKKLESEHTRLKETIDYELPKGWELDRVSDVIKRSSKNQSLVKAQKDFTNILRTEFKKMADAGNIPMEFYENSVLKHENYIPMFRQLADDDIFSPQPAYGHIKKREGGGEQQIKDPVESAINQILYYNVQAERNKFFRSLEKLVDNPKTSGYFKKLEGGQHIGKKDTFTVYNNGEATTYQVHKEIGFALDQMTPKQMNAAIEGLSKVTQTFKKGITDWNPLFYPVSTVRDGAQAIVNARHNVRVVRDIGAGLLDAFLPQHWKKQLGIKDYRSIYEQAGASHSQLISGDMNAKKILKQITDPKYASLRKYLSVIPEMGRRAEMSTRLSVMRATDRAGKNIADQVHEAVDVTNYVRSGEFGREFNKVTMFFNPSVRGLDRNIQMFREGPKALGKHGMKIAAYAMAPAALSASLPYLPKESVPWMSDDQRMKLRHLNDWEHNMFLHWPHPDGERIIRIHKPYGIGQLFMNPLQEVIRAQGENRAFEVERLGKEFFATNLPPMSVSMMTPVLVLSGLMSKDPLTGIDIVPQRLTGRETEDQYDHNTLEMAKEIGSWTGISPKKIEYVMQRSAGAMGDMTVSTLDYLMQKVGMLDEKKAPTATERQWHKRLDIFFRNEYTRSGLVSDAYEVSHKFEAERRSETGKIRDALRAENPFVDDNDVDRYLRKGTGMYEYGKELEREYSNNLVDKLGENAQLIRNIESSPNFTSEEKDLMIRNITREEMHFLEKNRDILNALKGK